MPAALPLTNLISQATTRQRRYRTLTAQFGDGYSQEVPDGINNEVDEWRVVYENLTTSERNALLSVLSSVKASDYLTWTPPGGSAGRFKLTPDGFSETAKSGDHYDISFTLRQVFGG